MIQALVQILPEADFIIALATTGDDLVRPLDRPRAKATLAALGTSSSRWVPQR